MDGGVQAHPIAVNRVALVYIVEQIVRETAAIIRFVHCHIRHGTVSFLTNHGSRKARAVPGVINDAIFAARSNPECGSREICQSQLLAAHTRSRFECLDRQLLLARSATGGYVFQHVRGNDAINR